MQRLVEGWAREAVLLRPRVWAAARGVFAKTPAQCLRAICIPPQASDSKSNTGLAEVAVLDKRRLVEFLVLRGISKNRFVWEMCFQYLDFDGDGMVSEQDFKLAFWGPDSSPSEAPNFSKINTERQLSARGASSANRYDKLKIPMQLEKSPIRDHSLEANRELDDIDEVFRRILISQLVQVERIKIQLYNTPGFTLEKAFNHFSENQNLATIDRLKAVCGETLENLDSKAKFFISSVKKTYSIASTDGIKIKEFRNAISPVCFSLEDLNWHQPLIQPTDSMVDYFDLAVNKYNSAYQSSLKSEFYNSKDAQELISKSHLRSDAPPCNSNLMFSFQDELRVVRGTSPSRMPEALESPDHQDDDDYMELAYQHYNGGQQNIQIGDFSLAEDLSGLPAQKKQSPPRPKIPVPSLSQLTSPFNVSKLQYSSQASSQLQGQQDANQTWNVWPPLLSDRAATGEVPTERLFQNSSEEQQELYFSPEAGLLVGVLTDEVASPRMPTVRKTHGIANSASSGAQPIMQVTAEEFGGYSGREKDITPPTSTERILRVKSGHPKTTELELSLTEQQRASETPGGVSAWRDEYQRKKTQPSGVSWLTGFGDNHMIPESEKRAAAIKEFSTKKGNTLITTQIIPKTTSTGLADTQNISSGYRNSSKQHLFSNETRELDNSCNWQSSTSKSRQRFYQDTNSLRRSEIGSTPRRPEAEPNPRHIKNYFDQIEISQHKNSRYEMTGSKSPNREVDSSSRHDNWSFGNRRTTVRQQQPAETGREQRQPLHVRRDTQQPANRPLFAYSGVRTPRYLG